MDINESVILLDDPIVRSTALVPCLPFFLGGEKRFKDLFPDRRFDAAALIADTQNHILARRQSAMAERQAFGKADHPGADGEVPP